MHQAAGKKTKKILSTEKFTTDEIMTDGIVFDNLAVMVVVLDKSGNVKVINKKGCEILQCEKKDVLHKNWFRNFIPVELREKMMNYFTTLMKGKEPRQYFENEVITKKGQIKFIRWYTTLLKDSSGEITGTISSGEDITESRRLQDELLVQSRNSEFLFNLSKIISDTKDLKDILSKSGKLLATYPGMLGGKIYYLPDGKISDDKEVTVFGIYEKIVDEDLAVLKQFLKKSAAFEIKEFKYNPGDSSHTGYQGLFKMIVGGELLGIFISFSRYMDQKLETFLIHASVELGRVIKRKKTEMQHQISVEKFSTVFDTLPDAISITTYDTHEILEVNKGFEDLTGFSRKEILGKNIYDLDSWVRPEERDKLHKRLLKEKKIEAFLTKIKRNNGEVFEALFSAVLVNFGGKKCMLAVIKDVTERMKIENEVHSTKQLLERITYTTPSFISLYDVDDDKILYTNKSILKSLGYNKEDIEVIQKLGLDWRNSFYHPDDIPKIKELDSVVRNLKEGEIAKIEYRIKNSRSKWQWFQHTAAIFQKASDSQHLLTINVFENISDRKKIEEELNKHSMEIELLYTAAKDLSGTLDPYEIYDRMYKIISEVADCKELIMTSYNPKTSMIKYEYLKAHAVQSRVDVSNIPPVPLAPRGFGIVSEVIRTGESIIIDDYQKYFEKVKTRYVINQDGDLTEDNEGSETPKSAMIIPVKLRGKVLGALQIFSAKPAAYKKEQLKFVESLMHQVALVNRNAIVYAQAQHEIQERKLAQEELKRSEKNLRQFAESVPDVLYRLNFETGKYDFLSPVIENMLGYQVSEIQDDPHGFSERAVHPDDLNNVEKALLNHIRHGRVEKPVQVECRMFKKDGSQIWVMDSIKFEYKNGKICAAIGAMSDITEKKLEEERRRLRDEKIIKLQSALLELSTLNGSDIDTNFQTITNIVAKTLGINRVSIWLFADNENNLVCRDMYNNDMKAHEKNFTLGSEEFEALFHMLKTDELIIGKNEKNKIVNKFFNNFLNPSGTCFALTQRILFHGNIAGFLMLETSDIKKTEWTPEEYDFAVSVTGFITLALESRDRMLAEEEIKRSLKDKEMLLREVHHRVKNNLQVISSLMYLQSKRSGDQSINEALIESQNRIRSMVMIHEKLYRSEDLASFNYSQYIRELTNSLFRSYRLDSSKINLKLDIGTIILDTDTAVHCGLIINELVSNAIKHAFPADRQGVISIKFHCDADENYSLTIGDNGVGIKNEFSLQSTDTLGMQLIQTLVEQLDGTLDVCVNGGTTFKIQFSLKKKL